MASAKIALRRFMIGLLSSKSYYHAGTAGVSELAVAEAADKHNTTRNAEHEDKQEDPDAYL